MIYKLVLGDWSDDGHGISKDFLFECNYDVHKIRQAYKDSCKKLGVTFNHNKDYTGLGLGYETRDRCGLNMRKMVLVKQHLKF